MKRIHLLVILAAFAGAAASAISPAAASGNRQCYYRPAIDPEYSCNTCSNTCLGAGYRCCSIVPD